MNRYETITLKVTVFRVCECQCDESRLLLQMLAMQLLRYCACHPSPGELHHHHCVLHPSPCEHFSVTSVLKNFVKKLLTL